MWVDLVLVRKTCLVEGLDELTAEARARVLGELARGLRGALHGCKRDDKCAGAGTLEMHCASFNTCTQADRGFNKPSQTNARGFQHVLAEKNAEVAHA